MLAAVWWLTRPKPVLPPKLVLRQSSFADLPGWGADKLAAAIPALLRSCKIIGRLPPTTDLGLAGKAADWQPICAAAATVETGDETAARAFFERFFTPYAARDRDRAEGLFTGYYQVSLAGRLTPEGRFTIPIYGRPPTLVTVDLGRFRSSLKGDHIAGQVSDGRLLPFPDRAAIDHGALKGKAPVLAWVADPIAAFFMQIQGSGEIELPHGTLQVGYAADNGRDYYAIGHDLIKKGILTRETVSLQSIRAWLEQHPRQAAPLMEMDRSYVFFRKLDTAGPVGASGAVLTARRSLAIDHRFVPYGVPIWLATTRPSLRRPGETVPLRRLMIAQDTGGAIRGPVRGDIYWGKGPRAAALAGEMKQRGRYWLLLPKAARVKAVGATVAARSLTAPSVPRPKPALDAPNFAVNLARGIAREIEREGHRFGNVRPAGV